MQERLHGNINDTGAFIRRGCTRSTISCKCDVPFFVTVNLCPEHSAPSESPPKLSTTLRRGVNQCSAITKPPMPLSDRFESNQCGAGLLEGLIACREHTPKALGMLRMPTQASYATRLPLALSKGCSFSRLMLKLRVDPSCTSGTCGRRTTIVSFIPSKVRCR
jgi:hypothetical protein